MNNKNIYSHRDGLVILQNSLTDTYKELLEILNFDDESELRARSEELLSENKYNRGTSTIYNQMIEERFIKLGWLRQPKIFADESYNSWKLDFGKQNEAAVEVVFNNGGYVGHIFAKLEISCRRQNRIDKDIQARIGIFIVASEELKKSQNFDGTVITIQNVLKTLHAYENMLTSPMVVFAIDAPKTFKIQDNKKQQDGQKKAGLARSDLVDRAKVINL